MVSRIISALTFTIAFFIPSKSVLAVCPVCTVAVGAGLGLSRFLGIDDTITGLWIGGLILSSSLWLSDWLKKQDFSIIPKFLTSHFPLFTSLVFYAITIPPLYLTNTIGHPFNTLFGLDKLVFGVIVGSIIFLLATRLDKLARKIKGRQLFIYQKVAFPVLSLVFTSLLFYLFIK